MMNYNILEILSYVVVAITTLTMIFGVFAYKLYKIREKRVLQYANTTDNTAKEKEQYLYFEEKELLW